MSVGRFRIRARLAGTVTAVLLVVFLSSADCSDCPKNCHCGLEAYGCRFSNGNIVLVKQSNVMLIMCLSTKVNFNCSDFPRFDLQFDTVKVGPCPASIVKCISDPLGLNQPFLLELEYITAPNTLEIEHVKGLKYLNTLKLTLGYNIPIPVNAINSLENLNVLKIFMGNWQQWSNARFNSTSIKVLYLDSVEINNTQTDLFDGLPNLKHLHIHDSRIGNVIKRLFKGLASLEYLTLSKNNIKSIESGVFLSTPRLRHLDINDNPLETLTDHVIEELLSLEILSIKCSVNINNNGSKFKMDSRIFSRLSSLKSITIKNCVLQKLPVHTLNISHDILTTESVAESRSNNCSSIIFTNLSSLTSLDLSNDSIYELPNVMFDNVTAIKTILLNDNKIKELSQNVFGNLSTLNSLDLSHNYIQVLHDGMFTNLTALKILKLDHNAIEILTLNLFEGLKSLTELYLQNNNIKRIVVASDASGIVTPFRYLANVYSIDLSYNEINRLHASVTSDMPNIKTLQLANNRFRDVWDFSTFFRRRNNVTLDLSNNNISQIKIQQERHESYKKTVLNGGRLNLDGNPIVCDCYNYVLFLRSVGIGRDDDPMFILGNTTCISPLHLKGKLITELSPTDLICDLADNDCPNDCTCVLQPATEEVFINCVKIPNKIKNYSVGYFLVTNYTLRLKTDPGSLMGPRITSLNLSDTNLTQIKFKPHDHLKILDVSKNNLTTIPEELLKSNITLYVADNPLECNCTLVKELKEYRIGDYKLVRCADGTELSTIDVGRLCAWRMILTGYIVMAIIVGIFLTKLAFSVYRDTKHKRMRIARILFRRGSEYSIQMETRLDMVKEYDLFISFAHEDTQFVREELLPKLENKYGQKVCIHDRDWIAGELIEEQIVQSVENSRRTIIILTEAFILSEWSYLEFRTAHNMSIREGRPRVIIILLDKEIVNDVRLSKAIKSYTLVNTYLVWEDPDFWNKLKRILPKQR